MAKKKVTPFKQLITTPLSIPTLLVFVLAATLITSYNLYMVQIKPKTVEKSPKIVMTQSDLMNVLGESISLGEKKEENKDQLKDDPQAQYWYDVLADRPDYRDAYIALAVIAYNKHLCTLAQSYLGSALNTDSLAPVSNAIKERIIACGK